MSPVELVKKLIHHMYGKLVLGCLGIESSVVDAETPRFVLVRRTRSTGTENNEVLGRMMP